MLFNENASSYVDSEATTYLRMQQTPQEFFADVLKNGQVLKEYAVKERHNELVIDSAEKGQIIRAANTEKKAKAYFESVLAFLPMSPMPDSAVNYYSSLSGADYSTLLSPERDTMYYSGAYYVKNYITSQKIELAANPYYYQKDNIHVTDQIYFYIGGESVDKPRLLFEAGDISEVAIQSTDLAG
ncbi:hypothetical protein FQA39_LY13007 [Lamprigera yunnana]|nr:hypothetical protein FQA39_LY13007 [Lamprigera yunnana]